MQVKPLTICEGTVAVDVVVRSTAKGRLRRNSGSRSVRLVSVTTKRLSPTHFTSTTLA